MGRIKTAIIGVGNCASSLIQGIYYYKKKQESDIFGLPHFEIGDYLVGDIDIVAALDIDSRKIGKDLSEAIFAQPNCTFIFERDVPITGVIVHGAPIMDGYSQHMNNYPLEQRFDASEYNPLDKDGVISLLKDAGTQVLVNFLPVGATEATHFFAECAIDSGCAFVNCIPVFISSDPEWAARFENSGLPVLGDDIKSQVGATIIHRALASLFKQRGVDVEQTYQINVGGNTDFLNMLNRDRLEQKKISKTEAVKSVLDTSIIDHDIHIGPSDYIAWLHDNKTCFLRIHGKGFGGTPVELEMKLSVEDSANAAAIVIDAIRCAKLALERGEKGAISAPSGYMFKHPLLQFTDDNQSYLSFIKYVGKSG